MADPGRFAAQLLRRGADGFAAGVVLRQREAAPPRDGDLAAAPFGSLQADTAMRIRYLAAALWADRRALFDDHLAWWKVALAARDVPSAFLETQLRCLRDELEDRLPEHAAAPGIAMVEEAARAVAAAPESLASLLEEPSPQRARLRQWMLAALEGRRTDALAVLERALDDGAPAPELQEFVVARAQAELGRMWQSAEIHVGDEHLASSLAEEGLALLRRRAPAPPEDAPRALFGTVEGDLHGLSARFAADRFAWDGWHVHPLGASMPAGDLARAALDSRVDLVVLSAQLAVHVPAVGHTIDVLRTAGEDATPPVLVGGRPFHLVDDLWQVVGADAGARDLEDAVTTARRLVAPPA